MKTLKKHLVLIAVIFAATSFIFSACKKDKDSSVIPNDDYALIKGKVVTPSGKPVGLAEVFANNYKTISDKDGNFSLQVSAGSYSLTIQTAKGHIFKSVIDVSVIKGDTLILNEQQTVLKQVKSLAYIMGSYDQIEKIIIDTLGYSATSISTLQLDSLSFLQSFGGIFLNCTGWKVMDSLKYTNLGAYVIGGGSLYASDWAIEYLTGNGQWRPSGNNSGNSTLKVNHGHVAGDNTMASCMTGKIGGFIPDSALCTVKAGSSGYINNADIVDTDLITLLGKDSINLFYDLGAWEYILVLDTPFVSMVEKPNSIYGSGVLATSCDLNGTVTAGGRIFYTTFHNHPQGTISNDVNLILQYFILNL